MGIETYSTTPGNNVALFPEGQAPSTVNDGMRQVQSDLRSLANDGGWFQYGDGDGSATVTYASAVSFSVASANVTATYHIGRRVRAVGSSTGTIYGSITDTQYAAGTTTVTMVWDTGSLSNEALTISLSQVPSVGSPTPSAGTSASDNLFVNGDFRVRQRGSSFTETGAGQYTADQWLVFAGTGGSITVAVVNFNPGSAVGADHPQSAISLVRTVTGATDTVLQQRIENVRTAEGQTVVVSFLVNSSVATSTCYLQVSQVFGTGGSPSTTVVSSSTTFTISGTSTWERKTVILNIASITGKTIGSNEDSYLSISFGIPIALSTGTFFFSNLDCRIGTTAPAKYMYRFPGEGLALCQRYYEVLSGSLFGGSDGGLGRVNWNFAVTKRATPAITLVSANGSAVALIGQSGIHVTKAASFAEIDTGTIANACL